MMTFSLGKWISNLKSSNVTQSLRLRYSRSVFSTRRMRHVAFFLR